MANKKFLLAILAIVLALGMAVVGCSKGSKGGNAEADGGGGGEPGTLTITGLPDQNFIVYVVGMDKNLSSVNDVTFAAGLSYEAYGVQNSSSGNVIKLYFTKGDQNSFTGKRQVVLVNSSANKDNPYDKNNPWYRTATVNFTNGGATVKFGSFKAVTN
jgi:hypothetical protein